MQESGRPACSPSARLSRLPITDVVAVSAPSHSFTEPFCQEAFEANVHKQAGRFPPACSDQLPVYAKTIDLQQ